VRVEGSNGFQEFNMAKKSKHNRTPTARSGGTAAFLFNGLVALVRPLVESQKELGVEKMTELANATQDYATALESNFNLGGYAIAAAESLTAVTDYVNENEFDQIVEDFSNFGRRHPVPMIIVGAIAGLAATQFFKSTEFSFRNSSSAKSQFRRAKDGRNGRTKNSRRDRGQSDLNASAN
jgi:hypothetical protein